MKSWGYSLGLGPQLSLQVTTCEKITRKEIIIIIIIFWDTNGSFNLSQTTRPSDSQQKRDRYE